MRKPFFYIMLLLLPVFLYGQTQLTTELDTNFQLIGDHNYVLFQLVDTSEVEGFEVKYEYWDTLPGIDLLAEQALVHKQTEELHYYQKKVRFTAFDSGAITLPPIEVSWKKGGNKEVRMSPAFSFFVVFPELDSAELSPIKPILKEPLKWVDVRLYVYSVLFLLLIAFFLYYYFKNRVNKTENESITEEIDPHEQAFTRLQLLEQKGYIENGQHEEFQVTLTHIMREFLSERYRIPAMESTSSEIIRQLEGTSFPNHKLPAMKELLTMADLVKFAKAEKTKDFHKRMFWEAKEIVHQTNPL